MKPSRVALAALLCVFAVPAEADRPAPNCAAREELVAALTGDFGETVMGRGLNLAGVVLEIWTSPAGTWTAVVVDARGRSCVVATGQSWEPVERPIAGRAT